MNMLTFPDDDMDEAIFPVRPISQIMREVEQSIKQVAPTPYHVVLFGETGTGKELAAKAIHQMSPRASKPFVAVNCAEFSGTLGLSQLYGHIKGAYTGAVTTHRGYFEEANGGTLFFDEIAEMSLEVQAQLLRAIQEMEIRRVGTNQLISLDLRFIAATNKNLEKEIKQGNFREDLYQRLVAFPICLPPLRHRKEDLPVLIDYFLNNSKILPVPKRYAISDAARSVLLQRAWRGNIRELRNVLIGAVIRCPDDTIMPEHLSPPSSYQQWIKRGDESAGADLVHERERLISILEKHEWKLINVARELGCSIRTLYRKIKKYGLNRNAHVAIR